MPKPPPKDPFKVLLRWINRREEARINKENGKPKPWTDDKIIQSTYFTNVRREDDKVTRWYAQNVREPLKKAMVLPFATIAFRWFNKIETGQVLLDLDALVNWNTREVLLKLHQMRNAGEAIFTGAFNISNSGSTKPKINRVCEDYIEPVWQIRQSLHGELYGKNLEDAFKVLNKLPGLGGSGFMAAQVVADLKYSPILQNAKDWESWCCLGPGSKKGLNYLLGQPMDEPLPKDWRKHFEGFRTDAYEATGLELHAQDFQNCLCELSKFVRVMEGGRSKRKYNGNL